MEELKDEIVKKVKTFYDNHDGKRTISVVNHVHGVTELEFYYTYISYSNPYTTVASAENTTNYENFTEHLNKTRMDSSSSTVTTYAVTFKLVKTGAMNTASACLPTSNTSNREYQWIKIQNISDGTHTIVQ